MMESIRNVNLCLLTCCQIVAVKDMSSASGKLRVLEIFGIFAGLSLLGYFIKRKWFTKQKAKAHATKLPDTILERAPLIDDGEDEEDGHKPTVEEIHLVNSPPSREDSNDRELSPPSPSSRVTDRDAADTLSALSRDASGMSREQATVLSGLLSTTHDDELLTKVLVTIGNAAAFTHTQNLLRDVGALGRLSRLLRARSMAMRLNSTSHSGAGVVNGAATAVANLALNMDNLPHLKECIRSLIEFVEHEESDSSVKLSSLQALTNLSVTSTYHTGYTQAVAVLYELLDEPSAAPAVRLQALRVLVNLSSNSHMVPHLMAAKAPCCLLELLSPSCPEDLLLRWLTVLANIMWIARDEGITYASLPTQHKAASPETMYTALYGLNSTNKLKSKVFVLSKHENSDVRYHATRIYTALV